MLSLLTTLSTAMADYPVPTSLPPNSWDSLGDKVFIHGCKAAGLFDEDELELASKFAFLTVEKGQGLDLPGYADDKMTALAAQWKAKRKEQGKPEGWAMFYINAKLDWTFYKLHAEMEQNPAWAAQMHGEVVGDPCLSQGDHTFPQPKAGMLTFNHSRADVRDAFVNACLNATTNGGFNGCFIDSAAYARGPPYPRTTNLTQENYAKKCETSLGVIQDLGHGVEHLLSSLQNAVGSDKLIIAKDSWEGGSEQYVNTIFPLDTFCSCYSCAKWDSPTRGIPNPDVCQSQIHEAIKLGKKGQAVLLHGEVNAALKGNESALKSDYEFTVAAFLIAASPSSFFGYSDGWYYNGTTWHEEYDYPLGTPLSDAVQGQGDANYTWTRSFSKGVHVKLDVLHHTYEIQWPGMN